MHPDGFVGKSSISGKGLFAAKKIPKGTIVMRYTGGRVYSSTHFRNLKKRYKAIVKKFAYEDDQGNLVYIAGSAKYWNHSCDPNTGPFKDVDIALRDIAKGEELTYDYAFLHPGKFAAMLCRCTSVRCRGSIKRELPSSAVIRRIRGFALEASKQIHKVSQPLLRKGIARYTPSKHRTKP